MRFNLLFLLLFFIFLIHETNQNEEKKVERIKNSIELIINSMKGPINSTMAIMQLNKYNISLYNITLFQVNCNDIKVNKVVSNNETFIVASNIKIFYNSYLNITLMFNPKNIITDKFFRVENILSEIKFKYINDYDIEYDSNKISSIEFSKC